MNINGEQTLSNLSIRTAKTKIIQGYHLPSSPLGRSIRIEKKYSVITFKFYLALKSLKSLQCIHANIINLHMTVSSFTVPSWFPK